MLISLVGLSFAATCSPLLFPSQVFSFAGKASSQGGGAPTVFEEEIGDALAKGRRRFVTIALDDDSGWVSLAPYPVSRIERARTDDILALTVLTFASGGRLALVGGQEVPDTFGRLHEVSTIGLGFRALKADGNYDTVRGVESRPVSGSAYQVRLPASANAQARLVAGDGYLATLGTGPCASTP